MDDLFFPLPAEAEPAFIESYTTPVLAARNPVANVYLDTVAAFREMPSSIGWLLDSGWANMPEVDRDGFVAAIIETYPQQVADLQTVYLNAFGRVGDPESLAYWTLNMLYTRTEDALSLLMPTLNTSPEYVSLLKTALGDRADLAALTTGQAIEAQVRSLDASSRETLYGLAIDHFYANVFGRSADSAGKAYWVSQLQQGKTTLLELMEVLIHSADSSDKAFLQAKSTIAYDAVTALIEHNVITNQDAQRLGQAQVQTALQGMQGRLREYDASELDALLAGRDVLIDTLLREAGLIP